MISRQECIYVYNRNEDIHVPSVKRIRAEIHVNFNTGSRRASCNVTRHGSSDRVSHDRTFVIPLNRSFPKSLLASVGFQRWFRTIFPLEFSNLLATEKLHFSLSLKNKRNESSFSGFRKRRKSKVEKREYDSLNSCSHAACTILYREKTRS